MSYLVGEWGRSQDAADGSVGLSVGGSGLVCYVEFELGMCFGWLVGRLVGWLVGGLVRRLDGWLVCWLVGWLAGWQACLSEFDWYFVVKSSTSCS